jgi:hypothetical protein
MASTTNKMCSRFAYVTLRINYSSSHLHFEKTSQSHLDIKVEDLVLFKPLVLMQSFSTEGLPWGLVKLISLGALLPNKASCPSHLLWCPLGAYSHGRLRLDWAPPPLLALYNTSMACTTLAQCKYLLMIYETPQTNRKHKKLEQTLNWRSSQLWTLKGENLGFVKNMNLHNWSAQNYQMPRLNIKDYSRGNHICGLEK